MILPDPPEGWGLKSLIEIEPASWSCQLWSAEEYVYGYGTSARYAMLDALTRIEDGATYGRLSGMQNKFSSFNLLDVLKVKPAEVERRD